MRKAFIREISPASGLLTSSSGKIAVGKTLSKLSGKRTTSWATAAYGVRRKVPHCQLVDGNEVDS